MNEANITMGEDPDYSKRDLYETIDKGGNVKWTMMVQVSQGGVGSGWTRGGLTILLVVGRP
jgi:catalase